jgi:glycerophosphoryl diester phosphodiesterase
MDIDDVIAIMNTHKDMHLITDTKASDYDTVLKAFTEIYRAAQEADPDILQRIVPQIYNPQMLKTLYQIYPFSNVIYTLYQSSQPPGEVLKFVEQHPSIKAVTMWGHVATDEFVANLSRINRPVYVHTINTFHEAFELYRRGVYGFYTDYLH